MSGAPTGQTCAMATLVIVLVVAALAVTFVTLAGGFDRVRRVRVVDPPVADRSQREVVRERVVERDQPVVEEREVRETVVERERW
jgi:hypothetical protein